MKKFALIGFFSVLATGALAQTTAPSTQPPATPPSGTTMPSAKPTPPIPGANSFTEAQAKAHIEKMGYTHVTDLKKDSQGIWHGMAMKDGAKTPVSLDYQGNVVNK